MAAFTNQSESFVLLDKITMLPLLVLLVSAVFAEASFHLERKQARIVNGIDVTDVNAFPYMVAILNGNGVQFCGGVLIKSDWVLTAAHCLSSPGSNRVLVNAVSLSNPGPQSSVHTISSVIQHPSYNDPSANGAFPNDIALVRLSVATEGVTSASLPPSDSNDYQDINAKILGWGSSSDFLQKFIGMIPTNAACDADWDTAAKIVDTQVCIKGDGGACNGDSGGPMMVYNTVVGVASFGEANCAVGHYSVYTRVSKYLAWINAVTNA